MNKYLLQLTPEYRRLYGLFGRTKWSPIFGLTVQLSWFANVHNRGWTAAATGIKLHTRAQGVSVVAIHGEFGVAPTGIPYLSPAADVVVSQVVDDVRGVHCRIRKADFAPWH